MATEQRDGAMEEELSLYEKIVERVVAYEREGSTSELKRDIDYLDHVRSNPTKNLEEALVFVHEKIERLGGYLTSGVGENDIVEIKKIVDLLIKKGAIPEEKKWMSDRMIASVEKRRDEGKVVGNSGILIALDPDRKNFLIADVQKTNILHLEFPDDEITPRSESDKSIDNLAEAVRKKAKEIASRARTLTEYVEAFYLDFLYGSYDGLAWIFKQGDTVTVDELVEDILEGDGRKEVDKKVLAIQEMKTILDGAPDKEGFVKVTIKKIRSGGDVRGLRVLAEFPEGVLIPHTGFDEDASKYIGGKQVVYYQPNAACYENAFSDANAESLLNQGREYKVYYMPVMDTDEAQRDMKLGPDGIAEYVQGRDKNGKKMKQGKNSFMWVALVHRGNKEDLHFRVSDFWKRGTLE